MDQTGKVTTVQNFPYANNLDAKILDDGTIWILSSAGIYIVNGDHLYADLEELPYRLLESSQGLQSSITANSWNYMDEDGCIYLSCASGIQEINVHQSQSYVGDYKLVLNGIWAENQEILPDEASVYQLNKSDKRVVVEPVVLDYTMNNPYVQYWLDGFETQKITVRQNELSQIVYTNLPSGNYQFHFAVLDEESMKPMKEIIITINNSTFPANISEQCLYK